MDLEAIREREREDGNKHRICEGFLLGQRVSTLCACEGVLTVKMPTLTAVTRKRREARVDVNVPGAGQRVRVHDRGECIFGGHGSR